jgi:nitrogen-specific signal transduction histidine kinase
MPTGRPHPIGVAVAVDDGCGGHDIALLDQLLAGPSTPTQLGRAGRAALGLAIAKGLVTAQGGEIAVEATRRGCRFMIMLPLATSLTDPANTSPALILTR